MTAVIYARYSSDNQREESIEGQIRECTAYAEKNGVHLISVMEPIAEGSQGILVETLLEGMAEYYSAELSEKVIRGQTENALKGKCTGGTGTIGYKIDEDKFYHLDPLTSPLVLEAFQRYDNGDKMVEIVNFLNDKGVRNMLGGKMTHSSVNTMLKNRRYIGELSFRDIVVPDAIPVIVPKDLFDRVQKRLDKNKRAPACGKADEEYLLTTKLFCGKCGALMFGESGTSATGRTYYYYKCANVKRRKGCNKKTVQKDWLEELVVRETMKLIQDDAVIDKIVQLDLEGFEPLTSRMRTERSPSNIAFVHTSCTARKNQRIFVYIEYSAIQTTFLGHKYGLQAADFQDEAIRDVIWLADK